MLVSHSAKVGGSIVEFVAFMENDGELVVTREIDGVEISREVISEEAAFALARYFFKDANGDYTHLAQ